MEPTFESHQSAEFDKSQHHIFDAKDVVSVLEDIEPYDSPFDTTSASMERIVHILTDSGGFGYYGLYEDAQKLEAITKDSRYTPLEIYDDVNVKLLDVARQLKEAYDSYVSEMVQQLNLFLAQHPGLMLWSEDPADIIDEIKVKTVTRSGMHQPVSDVYKLYVNVDLIDEAYRPLVIQALSDV